MTQRKIPMKLIVIADDLLWPANSGGRQVLRTEAEALVNAADQVIGVVFHRDAITHEHKVHHQRLFSDVRLIKRDTLAAATLRSPLLPYQCSSRLCNPSDLEWLSSLGTFDAIIAHHEWTLPAAIQIQNYLDSPIPIVLRSHNDEREYLRVFAKASRGPRAIYNWLEYARAKAPAIDQMVQSVDRIWTISEEDISSYDDFGVPLSVLPPILISDAVTEGSLSPEMPFVGYLGALDIPHATKGLTWFIKEVWPLVLAVLPHARFRVAGRRAGDDLQALLRASPNVDFFGEVEVAKDFVNQVSVFVNPVFSGSGVNIKLGDPLSCGIPIVSTSMGARGIGELASILLCADQPQSFAEHILALMMDNNYWLERSRLQSEFAADVTEERFMRRIRLELQTLAELSEQGVLGE